MGNKKQIQNEKQTLTDKWEKQAQDVLLNKRIVAVEYMSDEMLEQMGWYKRPIIFKLEDGTICFLSMDDEGNDGGVLFYENQDNGEHGVLPVLY